MDRIARAYATTSDRIRALDAAGYPRAEIAKFLNKRYQHVRNVLVAGPPKNSPFAQGSREPAGVEEADQKPYRVEESFTVTRLVVDERGRIELPEPVMQALGVASGSVLIGELERDRLVLLSVEESVRRVQALVRDLIPGDHSFADALIADRRLEAARKDG
jgi:bifunctional DNA-binding transcriptional regulator/antitoxin component of YhaV-PrlF toxin-antitoxin module